MTEESTLKLLYEEVHRFLAVPANGVAVLVGEVHVLANFQPFAPAQVDEVHPVISPFCAVQEWMYSTASVWRR